MRKFTTPLIVIVALFFFLFFAVLPLSAQESEEVVKGVEVTEDISSFDLFWPIVAGKTMGDPLYPLKNLKEKVRGWLIFGKAQKAEYSLLLATKRIVEAEKLIDLNRNDLADKTLSKGVEQLKRVDNNLALTEKETLSKDVIDQINVRLDNLEKFLKWLMDKSPDQKSKLEEVLTSVSEINNKI